MHADGRGWQERNWIGKKWMIEYNNGQLPSLNQIEAGLIVAAINIMRDSLKGNDEILAKLTFDAQRNLQDTWEQLFGQANEDDRNAPLKTGKMIKGYPEGTLWDPKSDIVYLLLFIYQMESYVY